MIAKLLLIGFVAIILFWGIRWLGGKQSSLGARLRRYAALILSSPMTIPLLRRVIPLLIRLILRR